VACYHFIPSVRFRSDKARFQYTILAHTLYEPNHGTVHKNLKRMVRKVVDQLNRNVLNPRLGGGFPFFLCREQVI
jgi:hypothetical protein